MQYIVDEPLKRFMFWEGAIARAKVLTDEQFEEIERYFEEYPSYPRPPYEVEINDMFWHYPEDIALICGFNTFEELEKHNNEA